MKNRSLLLLVLLLATAVVAQRPDSVHVNGQWYFVYPLQEKLDPGSAILDKMDLSRSQFDLFREWKLANDPRANLSKRTLIDSLNRELVRTKITVTEDQNKYEWREATRPVKMVRPFLMRKKHWYRNYPELLTNQEIDRNHDLVPAVQNLPNGKYIQYFEPILSYHELKNTTVLPTRVAAMFELKNNLPENEFTRFNYKGDTIRHGFFTDGLKEQQWTVSDKGTYLSYGIHGLRKENTISDYKISIRVELQKGILNGTFYKWSAGEYQPMGYFKNGYADSIWKINSTYSWREDEILDYNSILDSNYDQRLALGILPSVSLNRKYDGFDFKEKKNDYHNLTLYSCQEEMYEQGVPALPLVNFADLFDRPMSSGLSGLKTTDPLATPYRSNYRNTGHVNFHGTKQVFEGTRLTERYTYLPDLGAIVYARFFKNGAVFDTLGYEAQNKLFVHHVFDANGKLFRTTTYDMNGEQVQQINYYKRKETKIRYEKPVMIEGFETQRVYSAGKKVREWEGSRVIDGKTYTYISWKSKKRNMEIFEDPRDSSKHQLTYNRKGEVALEEVSVLVGIDSTKAYNQGIYKVSTTIPYKGLKLFRENEYDEDSRVVLTRDDQLYSGPVNIQFSNNKLKLDDQASGLNWIIPSDQTSRVLQKQFVELYANDDYYPMSVSEDPFYFRDRDYRTPFSRLMEELFYDQYSLYLVVRMEGAFQNGRPSGNWNYYDKKGELVFTLNFVNGLPNGDVITYAKYVGPGRYDRKYHRDEPYYDFLFSKDAPKNYRWYTYHFVDGKLDGTSVTYTAMGDTLEVEEYKMGKRHGKSWERQQDNVSMEEYRDGKLHGLVLKGKLEYNDRDEVVMDTLNYAHYENGLLNGDCYFEFYEYESNTEDYGGERRGYYERGYYGQTLKTVHAQFQQGLFHGTYVQRKKNGRNRIYRKAQ